MKFDHLRSLLLDQAIKGKLVPQLESEGEVEQLGNAPDEVPFEIPASWKWVRIELITSSAKQDKPMKMFTYIDVSSINNFTPSLINIIQADQAPSRARKIVTEGMVLYSMTRPYLMNTCIVPKLSNYTIASTAFAAVNCHDCLLNKYLLFILISKYFNSYVTKHQHGSSYPAINQKQFNNAYIPLPPLEEQKRIVAKLEKAFADLDRAEKAYNDLQELGGKLKNKILQKAIEGKLVPQLESEGEVEQLGKAPDEVPFEIPASWKWVLLDKIGRWKAGGTPNRSISEYYQNGTINWLKTGDLNDGFIDQVEECITQKGLDNSSAHINPIGAVLIAMYGATIGKLGILNIPCATNQACCACIVNDNIIYNKYLFYYLMSQKRSFISKGAGSGQSNISRKKIVTYPIPLPPLEEQKRIIAKVEALFEQIDLMVG